MAPPRRTTSGGALAPFRSKIPSETGQVRAAHLQAAARQDGRPVEEAGQGQGPGRARGPGQAESLDPLRGDRGRRQGRDGHGVRQLQPRPRAAPRRDRPQRQPARPLLGARRPTRPRTRGSTAGRPRSWSSTSCSPTRASGPSTTSTTRSPSGRPVSPGETRSEAQILQRRGADDGRAAREKELLEIDRGWDATASLGVVSLQRWKRSTPGRAAHPLLGRDADPHPRVPAHAHRARATAPTPAGSPAATRASSSTR